MPASPASCARSGYTPGEIPYGAEAHDTIALLLIAALADRWGWAPSPDGAPGKIVWAEYERRSRDARAVLGHM